MKDKTQRIEHINQKLKAIRQSENYLIFRVRGWRNGIYEAPIIKLEASFLKYRIENSRTRLQQLAYLHKYPNLPQNLFDDPESSLAQKAQEEILSSMVDDQDFLNDLRRRGQDEPAIITFDGFIINGNRRTTALKIIGTEWIDCVVLPTDATKKEIYELEQELQIAEDFKADYHWINELCNIREGLFDADFNITKEHMANKLRVEVKEIDRRLMMITLVDSFLIWKGIPGQYDYEKIDQAEQVFKQLEKALRTDKFRNNISKQDALKKMVFTLIEEKPKEERLYKWISLLIKNFDLNYNEIKEKSPSKETTPTENKESDDLIEQLTEDNLDNNFNSESFTAKNAKQNSEEISNILDKVDQLTREQGKAEVVYDSVSTALRELQGIFITNEHTKLEETKQKLTEIIKKANIILGEIDKVLKS